MTTVITHICDRDHSGQVPAVTTRTIVLDGIRWEIDLCAPCVLVIEEALAAVVKNARRSKPQARTQARTQASRNLDAAIRTFWRNNPDITDRPYQDKGRLPGDVVAQYQIGRA